MALTGSRLAAKASPTSPFTRSKSGAGIPVAPGTKAPLVDERAPSMAAPERPLRAWMALTAVVPALTSTPPASSEAPATERQRLPSQLTKVRRRSRAPSLVVV
ncbi:hypothetical protein D3C86_1006630 [compost metagenome]